MTSWLDVMENAATRFGLQIPQWRLNSLEPRIRGLCLNRDEVDLASLAHHPLNDELAGQMADIFSVPESSFFRENIHFQYFEELLRSSTSLPHRPWRILSAGCAGGEEAVSLAICLHRNGFPNSQVVGLDFSPTAVHRARQGIYKDDGRLFRFVNDATWQTYFEPVGDQLWQPIEAIRRMTQFHCVNLADLGRHPQFQPEPGSYQCVFCRNVVIYLTPQCRSQLFNEFKRIISPGGRLFLGISDCIPEVSSSFTSEPGDTPSVWLPLQQSGKTPATAPDQAVFSRANAAVAGSFRIFRCDQGKQTRKPFHILRSPADVKPLPGNHQQDAEQGKYQTPVTRPIALAGWHPETEGDVHIVSLHGFIDFSSDNSESLRFKQFPAIIRNLAIEKLIIETTDLKFICHNAMGSLIHLLKTLRSRGGDIKFVMTRPELQQYFNRQYFDQIFDLCDSRREALNAFRQDRNDP